MKIQPLFCFAWALSTLLPSMARAEIIRSFEADIRLQKDCTLDVTETIVMDFENAQRRGIYRKIPVRYDRYGGRYSVYLKVLSVTDENGNGRTYETSRSGRDLSIKIGDADRTITGVHTYRLKYQVRRALNFFSKAPEVYWEVTGTEWPFAMRQVAARFYPPPGVSISQIKTAAYAGSPGTDAPGGVQPRSDHIVFYTSNLGPGQGLTLVAGLPQGSVVEPSALQNIAWFLADWWPALLIPLLALGFLATKYVSSGRDVEGGQVVAVEWNPPTDLSPAEVGTLVDENCDMADIVSTLVDLAARGYLVIQESTTEKFLFLSAKDYTFIRTDPSPPMSALLSHEQKFLNGLFSSGNRATLSSLKNKFYKHLPEIRSGIYQGLMKKHLFTANPDTTRGLYSGGGIALIVLGFVAWTAGSAHGLASWGVGLVLSGILALAFSKAMPAKTATGSRALRQCLGFRRFVEMAEKDRIRVLAQDDPTIFGRLLPYAMVLGVADQWADAFKDLLTTPPDWYQGGSYHNGFSSHAFVNDLGQGMNSMGNTFSSQPKSTGGSGGSGFSGGGVGGGFGGGGGGSW